MNETLYPKRMRVRWRWDGETNEHITFQNPTSGSISVLNPIGARVFDMSDGDHTVGQIIDQLFREYDAPSREVIQYDVEQFLDFLEKCHVVRLLEP